MKTSFRRTGSQKGAFTRTELLAALLTTGALLSLQLPLIGTHRYRAQASACLENQRRLILAWQVYGADGDGWFPPNPDRGTTQKGMAWVGGQAGPGGAGEFNPDLTTSPSTSLLADYLHRDPAPFRCPADTREGYYQGTNPALFRTLVPAVRSVAMNLAVGTNPTVDQAKRPTDAPWLDNNHSHTLGLAWLTYGRESHFTAPGPDRTVVFLGEDVRSLNDGVLAFGMTRAEWIDWPATRHDGGATLTYADGHGEFHHWTDPRTQVGTSVQRLNVPGSADYAWLRERISAPVPTQ